VRRIVFESSITRIFRPCRSFLGFAALLPPDTFRSSRVARGPLPPPTVRPRRARRSLLTYWRDAFHRRAALLKGKNFGRPPRPAYRRRSMGEQYGSVAPFAQTENLHAKKEDRA